MILITLDRAFITDHVNVRNLFSRALTRAVDVDASVCNYLTCSESLPRCDADRRLTCWHANKPKAFPLSSRCPLTACGFAQIYLSKTLLTVDFLSVSVVDSGCAGSIIRSDGRHRDRGVNTRQKGER